MVGGMVVKSRRFGILASMKIVPVVILSLFALSGFSAEGNNITFRSDGNAVFAAAADGKPVWSETGLLFRERYTSEFKPSVTKKPFRGDVPMLQRHGRLHVILEKSPESTRGNVLVSLDLATQGKLVFRRDSETVRFVRFVSLAGDTLTVERDDGSTLVLDIATGQ